MAEHPLLTCPLCNGDSNIIPIPGNKSYIECEDCWLSTKPMETIALIKYWNKRNDNT